MPKKSKGKKIKFWVVSCKLAIKDGYGVKSDHYQFPQQATARIRECRKIGDLEACQKCDAQIHKCEVVRD